MTEINAEIEKFMLEKQVNFGKYRVMPCALASIGDTALREGLEWLVSTIPTKITDLIKEIQPISRDGH